MLNRILKVLFFIPVMSVTAIIAMFFVLLTPFVALTMWITIGRIDLRVYADFSESVVFYILDNWY